MFVEIKTSIAGDQFSYTAGDKVSMSDERGKEWIEAGVAEELSGSVKGARKHPETEAQTPPAGDVGEGQQPPADDQQPPVTDGAPPAGDGK